MAKVIKFNVKLSVDGKDQLVTATTTTKDLQRAVKGTKASTDRLRDSLITVNQKFEALRNGVDAFNQLNAKLRQTQSSFAKAAQLTGLTGDELGKVRNKAQAVADTFGEDFGEVMQAANTLAKAFGVSVEEAMRLLQDGMVGGANANGEFLDTMKEYPRYFKEAGISAEQFVAITANAAQQGIFSDKGVDAIKEGNLRIREMTTATASALEGIGISATDVQEQLQAGSTTTFEVMQRVAEKLKELPASSTAVGTAIADIFGGPGEDAGLEYLKSLADIQMSMAAVRDGADEYSKSLGEQADRQAAANDTFATFTDIALSMSSALNAATPYFSGLTQVMTLAANTLMTVNMATQAATKSTMLHAAATKILSAASSVWNTIAKFVTGSNTALGVSGYGAAAGVSALKMAIRGLMVATGVGIAVAALTMAVEALMNALDGGDEQTGKFADGMAEAKGAAESAAQTFNGNYTASLANMQGKYKALQEAWRRLSTEHQRNEWIRNNQSAFNELGLSVRDVKTAEDVFVSNTAAVVEAFKKRAKAAAAQSALEEIYKKKLQIQDRITARNEATTQHRKKKRRVKANDTISDKELAEAIADGVLKPGANQYSTDKSRVTHFTAEGAKRWNDLYTGGRKKSTSPAAQADERALAELEKKAVYYAGLVAEGNATPPKATPRTTTTPTRTTRTGGGGGAGGGSELKEIAGAQTEKELKNNISYFEQQRAELAKTTDEYAAWTAKIDEANAAIDKLQGKKVEEKKLTADPKTVKEFTDNLDILREKQQKATSPEEYQRLQAEIDKTNKAFATFKGEVEEVDEAVKGVDLSSFTGEVEELKKLTGEALTFELREQGFSSIYKKMRKLRSLLDGGDLTDKQREEVNGLIETYGDYAKQSVKSFDTVSEVWNDVTSIGDSISSMTEALEGNGNAWEKITAVVGGAMQIYQVVNTLLPIISTLLGINTTATTAETTATTAETAAKEAAVKVENELAMAKAVQSAADVPFPGTVAAIAANAAAVLAALGSVKTAGAFATGGIVGGNSPSGDRLLARVNSGEMILNRRQQERLLRMLNGTLALTVPQMSYTAAAGGQSINLNTDGLRSALYTPQRMKIETKMRGRDFKLMLANETRISSKSGRRSNIII